MEAETAEEPLRIITETICEVVWIAAYDLSRQIYVSPAYERVWGRTCESLYRDPGSFLEAIHPDDRARVLSNLQTENEGLAFDHEYRIIRADGAVRWIWDRGYPVRTAEGKVDRYVGVAQDITERKRAEQELAATAERLHLLSRATKDAMWDWDIVANTAWWSDVHYEEFGYSRGTVPSFEAWADRVHVDDRPRVLTSFKQVLESGGDVWTEEYRFLVPGGPPRQILDRAYVLHDEAGKPVRMLGAMMDVTEQRRVEVQLRQAQKVEAVGQLAAGIAHDFNNILSIVLGHAELLLAELGQSGSVRDGVEEIRDAASRGADFTRQLLTFSRQQILQPRKTDIGSIVTGMTPMLKRLLGEDIELSIEGSGAALVLVDPAQITQMFLNLAVNARDAMPRGGCLTIRTADVEVPLGDCGEHSDVEPGNYVVIRVGDTGVGMDPATQAQMFEPFFTTKAPGRGTGLGLATVRGIVDQSGGKIFTTSELGRGTTFRIYFPQAGARPSSGHAGGPVRAPLKASAGVETLLLVEDDHALRAVLRSALLRHGYRVLEAPNGREALLLSDQTEERIDLVLTDVVMPYMSGPEFAERLSRSRPGMKVLYMSGYTDGVLDRHGVSVGEIAFLQKPITPGVLVEKVREVLADERALA